jgi:uncharacterized protein (DUF1778 family)
MPTEERDEGRAVLAVSLPAEADRLIRAAAKRRHKTASAFVRDAAIEQAERVLTTPAPIPEAIPA